MPCKEFRVGVFFDGTGNSKEESATYSNVAKLHELYEVKKEKQFVTTKIYVTGVGTAKKGDGSYMQVAENDGTGYYGGHANEGGLAMGTGDGGARRIYDAIDRVTELLDAHPYGDKKEEFKNRQIDVFGFSRGAAEARDFVNTFIEKKINKYPKKYGDVRFNFIGIFDTVGSFGVAGNDIDYKPRREYVNETGEGSLGWSGVEDHQDDKRYESYNFNLAAGSAKHIVHFTAADEVRHNFPLYECVGEEVVCIGAHSDVGGGYETHVSERLAIGTQKLPANQAKELHSLGWKYHEKVDATMIAMSSYGSGMPNLNAVDPINTDAYFSLDRVLGNELAHVALHLMHQKAVASGVPLKSAETYPISPSIQSYYDYALHAGNNLTGYPDRSRLWFNHAHQSATHPNDILPYPLRLKTRVTDVSSVDRVEANDAHVIGNMPKREHYTNKTSLAVTPKTT